MSIEGLLSQRVLPHTWLPHTIVLSVVGMANLILPSVSEASVHERLIGPLLGGGLAMEVAFTPRRMPKGIFSTGQGAGG